MKWFNLDDSVNAFTLLGAVAILALTIFIAGGYIKKMKSSKADGVLKEEEWDGIKEFSNDIPVGWGLTQVVLLIWGLWYWFVGYPLNAFSQIGQYNDEVKAHNAKFEAKWQNADAATYTEMGKNIFLVQCSQCHGITSEGMDGRAANLMEWGREEGLIHTMQNGSQGLGYPLGVMTPMADMGLENPEDLKAVAAYVMAEISEVKKTKYPELVSKGKELFTTCSSCHGEDGRGMEGMAPDLSKYGTPAFVAEVLDKGKKGKIGGMPSFKGQMFTDTQKNALAHYIFSNKE